MAQNRMMPPALLEQLQGADTDVLRRVREHAIQRLIEPEAATQIGADPHERSTTRTTYRNGYRERILDTGSGCLELQIPKLRSGSFFPTLLEPRRRIDRATQLIGYLTEQQECDKIADDVSRVHQGQRYF